MKKSVVLYFVVYSTPNPIIYRGYLHNTVNRPSPLPCTFVDVIALKITMFAETKRSKNPETRSSVRRIEIVRWHFEIFLLAAIGKSLLTWCSKCIGDGRRRQCSYSDWTAGARCVWRHAARSSLFLCSVARDVVHSHHAVVGYVIINATAAPPLWCSAAE